MRVALFGATGMVGRGVLRECLRDPEVTAVVSVGRSAVGVSHPKLREVVHDDLFDLSRVERELTELDACLFCLGVTSAGMREEDYRRVTRDLAVSVAGTLLRTSPRLVFVFVSGAGTDSSERGRTMWARVKGEAENALLAMPFRGAWMVRPAFIQPLHGIRSRTALYNRLYLLVRPFVPLLLRFPSVATTTERLARAMLRLARREGRGVVESREINELGRD